jgi:phosphatidylserine synthase
MTAQGYDERRSPPPGWLADLNVSASLATIPNLITLIRTMVATVLAVAATSRHSTALLVAAYLSYWVGDMLDAASARLLRQETRVGAVFDILADRACASVCAAALVTLRPDMVVPIAIFVVQFTVVDSLLSLAFLRWPILSPNYFGLVDPAIYRWNWSMPAKALNTGALVVLVIVAPSPVYPAVFALAVTMVKVVSLVAVVRLPPHPAPSR